ncbi:hypothetical protein [Castellaniella sp.]|uniref:hypothetical protein n=1 Tax=Castellaniella sp. TaxID=1955812 RepID=UPI002AFE8044|nr:hypothetical protein [Castellaniella sp.]
MARGVGWPGSHRHRKRRGGGRSVRRVRLNCAGDSTEQKANLSRPPSVIIDAREVLLLKAPGKAAPKPLSDEAFAKKSPGWKAAIESGKKSVNDLITTIQPKDILTEDQKGPWPRTTEKSALETADQNH